MARVEIIMVHFIRSYLCQHIDDALGIILGHLVLPNFSSGEQNFDRTFVQFFPPEAKPGKEQFPVLQRLGTLQCLVWSAFGNS